MPNSCICSAPAPAYRVRRDTNTDTPLPPDEPARRIRRMARSLIIFLPHGSGRGHAGNSGRAGQCRAAIFQHRQTGRDRGRIAEAADSAVLGAPVRGNFRPTPECIAGFGICTILTPEAARHDYPIAAIPHDTPRVPLGPTALPGMYTVRLTVDGKTASAPLSDKLTIKMDPRVKVAAAGLEKKLQAEMKMASILTTSTQAVQQGGSIRAQLEKLSAQANALNTTKEAIEAAQKKLAAVLGAAPGFLAPPSAENTLTRLNGQADTLYQQIWQADAEPTSAQMEALATTEHDSTDVLKRWNEFKNSDLPALNRVLRESEGSRNPTGGRPASGRHAGGRRVGRSIKRGCSRSRHHGMSRRKVHRPAVAGLRMTSGLGENLKLHPPPDVAKSCNFFA